MTRWDLTVGDQTNIFLVATLDEPQMVPNGDPYMPSILMPFNWEEFVGTGARQDAWRRVQAVAISLHIPGNQFLYWTRTGLLPVSRAHQPTLPLSHALIEELTRRALARADGAVVLDVSIQALAEPQNGGTVRIHWHQGTQPVFINAVKWHGMLKHWGYPAVRLVPLYTELPQPLGDSNKTASAAWSAACSRLKIAHEKWVAGNTAGSGEELRHVVQLAIRTWGAIWHPDSPPGEQERWAEIVRRLGGDIPDCDTQAWTLPAMAPADAQRAFAMLTLLRNLNTIANPFHHIGLAPVYATGDTDMLRTATTAVLRNLPEFWRQCPGPPRGGN